MAINTAPNNNSQPHEHTKQPATETVSAELPPSQKALLQSFYVFSRHKANIEPRRVNEFESPLLSFIAHDYLHDQAARQIARKQDSDPEALHVHPWRLLSKDTTSHYINQYYRDLTPERQRGGSQRSAEERRLAGFKRLLYANVSTPDLSEKAPRYEEFPELKLGISLEEGLRKEGHETAADSVEVVLAAHGMRIWDRVRRAAYTGIVRTTADEGAEPPTAYLQGVDPVATVQAGQESEDWPRTRARAS